MNKNSFNLRRCWSLLKGDLRNNRTDILLLAGVLFLVVIAVALFSVFTPSLTFSQATGITLSGAEIAALTAMSNIGLVVMVAEVVIFSRVFANMSTRSGEINYLMLPATNSEKWLSRVSYVVLVGLVFVLAIYYLAILCCGLIGHVFDVDSLSLIPKMTFDTGYIISRFNFTLPLQAKVVNYVSSLFFVAVFVLGGTWFRRLPWLYTALILLGTSIVLAIGFGFCAGYYLSGNQQFMDAAVNHDLNTLFDIMIPWFYASSAILLVLSIVMLWLSYRLFCRRQLEARKIRIIR